MDVADGRLVKRSEIAELAGIKRATVTNWERRHVGFPKPRVSGELELFELGSVVRWLEGRTVPVGNLRRGEAEGTTYAERVRRALGRGEAGRGTAGPEDPDRAKKILDELHGPPADRVRGTGPHAAYLTLLATMIFLRGCAARTWARVRDLVAEAVQEQRPPAALLRELGALSDKALRRNGIRPGAEAAFGALRTEDAGDIAHVVRLCEGLGREGFRLLVDRFEETVRRGSEEFSTPAEIMRMMAGVLLPDPSGPPLRWHDPYARAGEALVAVVAAGGEAELSGESPHQESLRLAELQLALYCTRAELRTGTATPWTGTDHRRFDRILTNPPFNRPGRDWGDRAWPFGTPPARNDNLAWLQHVWQSLAPGGRAGVVMPNAAADSGDAGERAIRGAMVERGAVTCVVWLPGRLFPATGIAVTVWFLAAPGTAGGPVLLVDAARMGTTRGGRRFLTDREWASIVECHESWENGDEGFADLLEGAGTALSVPVEKLRTQGYSLSPSDYAEKASGTAPADVPVPRPADALGEARERVVIADRAVDGIRVEAAKGASAEWPVVRLGDLCDAVPGPSGTRLKEVRRSDGGVPLIAPKHIRGGRVIASDPELIDPEEAERLVRFRVEDGDLLVVRTGSAGRVALVTPRETGWIYATNLTRLRCRRPDELDPRYLFAYLSAPAAQGRIGDLAARATVIQSLGKGRFEEWRLPLPPLAEQRRVGDAVHALDEQVTAHRALADEAARTRDALAAGLVTGLLSAR
ncbi:N-6 DNA methylase [Actinomadura montaniterrae]|uniref:N-6 DNA methylase n=1 Tax=Actinomadura montaniterrae TaxID=1803903 RepID=A0A6L3VGT5_9ACTN|nr:N-6 DNA methylase [Actinomadura montaniterrae]KAB2366748.1 N-6 DNA methylase [Actinomadura montaniterrae]